MSHYQEHPLIMGGQHLLSDFEVLMVLQSWMYILPLLLMFVSVSGAQLPIGFDKTLSCRLYSLGNVPL